MEHVCYDGRWAEHDMALFAMIVMTDELVERGCRFEPHEVREGLELS